MAYRLMDGFGIFAQDTVVWEDQTHTALLGIEGHVDHGDVLGLDPAGKEALARGQMGETTVTGVYTPGNGQGEVGEARFHVDTSLPLTSTLSVSLQGGMKIQGAKRNETHLGLGVDHVSDALQAGIAGEWSSLPTGEKALLKAHLSTHLGSLGLQGHGNWMVAPAGSGSEVEVRAALPVGGFTLQSAAGFKSGVFSSNLQQNLWGELRLDSPSSTALQGSVEAAYQHAMSNTAQFTAQTSYRFMERLGIEGRAGTRWDGVWASTFGVGLQFEPIDRWVFSAGYNFVGFESLTDWRTEPGVYLELKLKL